MSTDHQNTKTRVNAKYLGMKYPDWNFAEARANRIAKKRPRIGKKVCFEATLSSAKYIVGKDGRQFYLMRFQTPEKKYKMRLFFRGDDTEKLSRLLGYRDAEHFTDEVPNIIGSTFKLSQVLWKTGVRNVFQMDAITNVKSLKVIKKVRKTKNVAPSCIPINSL